MHIPSLSTTDLMKSHVFGQNDRSQAKEELDQGQEDEYQDLGAQQVHVDE